MKFIPPESRDFLEEHSKGLADRLAMRSEAE